MDIDQVQTLLFVLKNGTNRVSYPSNEQGRITRIFQDLIKSQNNEIALLNLALLMRYGNETYTPNLQNAVRLYEICIQRYESTAALFDLACILQNDNETVPRDIKRATQLFRRAIEKDDHIKSMVSLGIILVKGDDGVAKDVNEALKLFKEAIENDNDREAMCCTVLILHGGFDGKINDTKKAIDICGLLLQESHIWNLLVDLMDVSICLSGENDKEKGEESVINVVEQTVYTRDIPLEMLDFALGLQMDIIKLEQKMDKAIKLYEHLIDKHNDIQAMKELAIMFRHSSNIATDRKRAAELYERAITTGRDKEATYELAIMLLEEDDDLASDVNRSIALLETLVEEHNDYDAMVTLGNILIYNKQVTKDAALAMNLYTRAINEGNLPRAKYRMARVLLHGDGGVKRDVKTAAKLFEELIDEHEDPRAMYNLGHILERGSGGMTKDVARAFYLHERAVEKENYHRSKFRIARLLHRGDEGIEPDIKRAAELYESLIEERGDRWSMYHLSQILYSGANGVARDIKRSAELLIRSGKLDKENVKAVEYCRNFFFFILRLVKDFYIIVRILYY